MTERFDHTKLPTWNSLTDSECYWAGCLARQADDNTWVKEWRYSRHCMFLETWTEDQTEFIRMMLCESLMLALTTPEPTYMLRSLLEAARYLGRLHGASGMSTFHDAYLVARNRVDYLLIPRQS